MNYYLFSCKSIFSNDYISPCIVVVANVVQFMYWPCHRYKCIYVQFEYKDNEWDSCDNSNINLLKYWIYILIFWLVQLLLALNPLYRKLVCPWMWNSGSRSKFQLECECSISFQQHNMKKIWYEICRFCPFFQKVHLFSADEKFDGTYQTNVVVGSEGHCLFIPPGIFKVKLNILFVNPTISTLNSPGIELHMLIKNWPKINLKYNFNILSTSPGCYVNLNLQTLLTSLKSMCKIGSH